MSKESRHSDKLAPDHGCARETDVTHAQALANVINILGINAAIADTRKIGS